MHRNDMTNHADFWTSIALIIKEGFTPAGLQQLDRYAELFISEELVYKRFSPFEQYGCSTGGTTHVIATLLAGAEVDADTLAQGVSDFKRMCQRGETQALRIEEWAKAVGVWIDDIDESFTNAFGERIAEGGEAIVYDHGATLVKTIGLDYFVEPNSSKQLQQINPPEHIARWIATLSMTSAKRCINNKIRQTA